MARGKKKESALTPEEKLAQALVSEDEQPYKVPENWCWTRLKTLSAHISDGSHNPPKDAGSGIPLLSATNIRNHSIDVDGAVRWITESEWETENQRTKIEPNDVLLTIVATLGRTAVVRNEKFALQRSVAVIKPRINSEFLSYYFETPYVQTFIVDNAKGTAQKGFYLNSLENLFCCVPPLAEQQRIIDRIEYLFAKLDEAKEKAQSVLDSFETRKAAILHKAFIGELTAKWRAEHGVEFSWERLKIGEFADVKGGKRLPKGHSLTTEKTRHPYLRIADFGEGTIDQSDLHYITDETYAQISRYIITSDDVYLSIVGTIGKAGVIPEELSGANLTENAARIVTQRTLPQYLCAYLSSPVTQDNIQGRIRSATLGKLSLLNIKDIAVPIPTKEEQKEIVRILDRLFAKEQQAKKAAEAVLEKIDLLKKSILARAFRGELGTNDPTEESALELMKAIIC